jgi:hypothetical protein
MLYVILNHRQNRLIKKTIISGKILATILIALFVFQLSAISQNIDAKIETGGQYIIRAATDTFMTVTQSTGYMNIYRSLTLPVVVDNSTAGTVYKGANRFIHTYEVPSTTGQNTFIGLYSGNFTMTGGSAAYASYNTAVGYSTLTLLTTGYYNSAFGWRSLYSNTDGSYNSAFGMSSLYNNSSGQCNSAFGKSALESNTTANYNSAFGTNSLHENATGDANSAFGATALYSNTEGDDNSAFGSSSLETNTIGFNNSAFGRSSLYSNTDGNSNSAFGFYSLYANINGSQNSAFGMNSLHNDTGSFNSAFGNASLYSNTGDYNSAFGYSAASNLTSGSNVTCIGYYAQASANNATNEITLGNGSVGTLRCHATSLTYFSDVRDKKNIRDLTLGIDFLMKVKPRLFNWDRRDWYKNNIADGSKIEETPTAGFIAQELDEVQTTEQAEWLRLVMKNNPDRLEATPGNLLPIIVKAIQDIKIEKDKEIAILKSENESKNQQIADLNNKLAQFEEIQKLLVSKMEKLESTSNHTKEVKMSINE